MMDIVVMNVNKNGMMNRKEYNKLYHQRPDVIEKKKKYFKEYNARPEVKQARHEWYIQRLIKEVQCQDIK